MKILQKLFFLLLTVSTAGTIVCSDSEQEYTSPSAHAKHRSKKGKSRKKTGAKDTKPTTHPLHRAVKEKDHEKITRLIANDSTLVNSVNSKGYTPLHIAAQQNSASCIELLTFYKANIEMKSRTGKTAINYASEPTTYGALFLAGAQPNEKTKNLYGVLNLAIAPFKSSSKLYQVFSKEIDPHISIPAIKDIIFACYVDDVQAVSESSKYIDASLEKQEQKSSVNSKNSSQKLFISL